MTKYSFETDDEAEIFCEEIYMEMMAQFGISKEEAIARINQQWKNQSLVGDDIVYHETAEVWAKDMYWGHEAYWWITGEKREELKLPPLTPKPLRKP